MKPALLVLAALHLGAMVKDSLDSPMQIPLKTLKKPCGDLLRHWPNEANHVYESKASTRRLFCL